MAINTDKIDQVTLALMYLTLHDENRAWKQIDWDVISRLHKKGYIADPKNKAKSLFLTEEGLQESKVLFQHLFID